MVRSGRMLIPGESVSTKNAVIAWWLGVSASPVRVSKMHRCEYWAKLVQTFWPLMIHLSPRWTARVVSEARSLPEPGSENPWHHCSSPDSSFGTISAASSLGA